MCLATEGFAKTVQQGVLETQENTGVLLQPMHVSISTTHLSMIHLVYVCSMYFLNTADIIYYLNEKQA